MAPAEKSENHKPNGQYYMLEGMVVGQLLGLAIGFSYWNSVG